jgi:hypothetical protein
MSRIYFHSQHGTAELRGSERAYMGGFAGNLLCLSMGVDYIWGADTDTIWHSILPRDHYVFNRTSGEINKDSLETLLKVGSQSLIVDDKECDVFTLSLNTMIRSGGDVFKLMAKLHGQCEIHAWVAGEHRKWLAEIISFDRTRDGKM